VRLRALPLVAVLCLVACGGDEERAAAPAKPSVTPFPTIDRADLEPGTEYTSTARRSPSTT
jgi:hypothetical protein